MRAAMGRTDIANEEHALAEPLAHVREEPRAVREHGIFVRGGEAESHERQTGASRGCEDWPNRMMDLASDGALEGLGGVFSRVRILVLWITGKGWRDTIK
jgi:hypothetical protein